MTTLPAWLPAVIAGGLAAAAALAVVGVASAAVDWRDARRARRSYPRVNSLSGSTPLPGRSPSPTPQRPPTATP